MAKIIKSGTEARSLIKNGINLLALVVGATLGPKGRTVAIEGEFGEVDITNDGVTVANSIMFENPIEQLGAKLVQQAANKTNKIAGDGTTTTVVLTDALVSEGVKMVEFGGDPVAIRRGMNFALENILIELDKITIPIKTQKEMAHVATISSRDLEIGKIVSEALFTVGENGTVTVEYNNTSSTDLIITKGMQFDRGYKSPHFVTDQERLEAVIENPLILITDKKISSVRPLVPLIDQLMQSGRKDLVVIAGEIEGDALQNFILNKIQGKFNVLAIQAPSFGDKQKNILQDIALLTGATFVSNSLGVQLDQISLEDLGSCFKIVSTKDSTTIIDGRGDKKLIDERINEIKSDLVEGIDPMFEFDLKYRLAKLDGGIGVIRVGAATEVAMKELKYLIEDALNATKAAISQGVVVGGGSALVKIAHKLKDIKSNHVDENGGIQIVLKAILAPIKKIAQNSGVSDISMSIDQIQNTLKSGYDFLNMRIVDDMIKAGIIDPVLVTREALINSISVAGGILTTEAVVVRKPEESKNDKDQSYLI